MPTDKEIQETVQTQERFLQWVVQTWREKNWPRLLLILEAAVLILLNPKALDLLLGVFELKSPRFYLFVWIAAISIIFIIALVLGFKAKAAPKEITIDERRTIKGLRPFYFDDAEVFDRLQRNEIIRECVSAITDHQFRFGVLSGQSGSGKTSVLQAGLWPALARSRHQCVYVKFTESNPLETLRAALTDANILSRESSDTDSVSKLLDSCALPNSDPLVLLFDQFEQFFLQNKRISDRKPFIAGLADWYQTRSKLPTKILICIRSDFSDRLIELQKTMGYSLGPLETFRLDRFDPHQAAAVLRVIAQTEGITVDEAFVEELANQQLAGLEDGLISPVDIQILSLMVAGENDVEDRAFNRVAYEALGGIEGLLEKFLKRALNARESTARQQAALNVLLALTDFENDSRAGTFTFEQLAKKVESSIKRADLAEAIAWLGRSDVRLITPNQQGDVLAYELAHERLIPALRRLTDRELSEVDLAKRLLERKVSEWVVNGKKFRYLLRGRDLRLVKRHRAQMVRNPQKDAKATFLARSVYWFRFKVIAVAASILIAASVTAWWFSPSGQIWQAERELALLTDTINEPDALYRISKNLLKADRLKDVRKLTKNLKRTHRIEIAAQLRRRYEELGDVQASEEIKRQMDDIDSVPFFAPLEDNVDLGIAYSKIGDSNNASKFFDLAKRGIGEGMIFHTHPPRPQFTRSTLSLAQAYQEIGDSSRSVEELRSTIDEGALTLAGDPLLLIDVALLCERLGPTHCDGEAWEKILHFGENLSVLHRVVLLSTTARALSASGQYKVAEGLLQEGQEKLREMAVKPQLFDPEPHQFVNSLGDLYIWVSASGKLRVFPAKDLLGVTSLAMGVDHLDSTVTSQIFAAMTQAFINIGKTRRDISYLHQADGLLNAFDSSDVHLYLNLSSAYLDFGEDQRALQTLNAGCSVLNTENKFDERSKVTELISKSLEKVSEDTRRRLISDDSERGMTRVSLMNLYIQLLWHEGKADEARNLLAKAELLSIKRMRGVHDLLLLANTCTLMGETRKARRYLNEVTAEAMGMPPNDKADILFAVCDLYARNNEWRQARLVAEQTGSDIVKAVCLSNILAVWNEHK